MNAAQSQILALFQSLPPDEQQALLPRLVEQADEAPFIDDLTANEIAAIEEGLAQLERGEVVDADVVLDRIAARYNFPRA